MKQIKEFFRKQLVGLKHNPQRIPFIFLIVTCAIFTFALTNHSRTIVQLPDDPKVNGTAFSMFVVTLSSIMSIISFVGFKRLNRKGIVAFVITLSLLVLQIALQIIYINTVNWSIYVNGMMQEPFMQKSVDNTVTHIVFLSITVLAVALLPLYSRLLKKIKTTPSSQLELNSVTDSTSLNIDKSI